MARLVAFGHRWDIASDDLFIPYFYLLCLHIVWLILTLVILSVTSRTCDYNLLIIIYIPLFFLITSLLALSDLAILVVSLRGTVADDRPRRIMGKLVECNVILTLLELALQGYALYLYSIPFPKTCSNHPGLTFLLIWTVLTTFVTLIIIICIIVLFHLARRVSADDKLDEEWQRRLKRVFSFGTSVLPGQEALDEIARFFGEYFDGVDLAPTDVMVGLSLLGRAQEQSTRQKSSEQDVRSLGHVSQGISGEGIRRDPPEQPSESRESTDSTSPILSTLGVEDYGDPILSPIHRSASSSANIPANHVNQTDLSQALHFLNFAEAIYGLPLYIAENPWKVAKAICCCWCCAQLFARKSPTPEVWQTVARQGKLFPFLGTSAESLDNETLDIESSQDSNAEPEPSAAEAAENHDISALHRSLHADLLYISHTNSFFRSPYFVSIDHKTRNIVIAVRGTLSTADVLVDLSLHLTELEIFDVEGDGRHWAHTGMLRTAMNILKDLEKTKVLKRKELEVGEDGSPAYGLCVVGHSLGAGVATLLCHLLRKTCPTAICYAFSPPGCLVSSDASDHFAEFCTSVVLNYDLVPRLSRASLERIKRDIAFLCTNCNVHKARVLLGGFSWTRNWTKSGYSVTHSEEDVERMQANDQRRLEEGEFRNGAAFDGHVIDVPNPDELQDDPNVHIEPSSPTGATTIEMQKSVPMFVPGRILHIIPISSNQSETIHSTRGRQSNRRPPRYTARWAEKNEFTEILLSRSMLMDHLPFRVRKGLEHALDSITPDE